MKKSTQLCRVYGRNVKARRLQLGLTQAQLAARLSTSQPYIAQIEAGRKWPYASTFAKIAAGLMVKPSELLKIHVSPSKTAPRGNKGRIIRKH